MVNWLVQFAPKGLLNWVPLGRVKEQMLKPEILDVDAVEILTERE